MDREDVFVRSRVHILLSWCALGALIVVACFISITHILDVGEKSLSYASNTQLRPDPFDEDFSYSLRDLVLLKTTMIRLEDEYVSPERFDLEAMLTGALTSAERVVPNSLLTRKYGGDVVHVEIGSFRETISVPPLEGFASLYSAIAQVVDRLNQYADPDRVLGRQQAQAPMAPVEYALVNGLLTTLDPHSMLLPPVASKEMDEDNEGAFGGLGVTILNQRGRLIIDRVLPNTPADRMGLQEQDHLSSIDGVSTINMGLNGTIGRLRGVVGTMVSIGIIRDKEAERIIEIERAEIRIAPVVGSLLAGRVGWFVVPSFYRTVDSDLAAEFARLRREHGRISGVILDLRGNPGGYLSQAVDVADRFLSKGEIVSTVARAEDDTVEKYRATASSEPNTPLVVLVDSASASASEIVAGALRNNGRAVVVGERTFGKGSVQHLYPMPGGAKLKMTVAQYRTPGDESIQSVGVPADIELVPTIFSDEEDAHSPHLFRHEMAYRESKLHAHLTSDQTVEDRASYRFRYVQEESAMAEPDYVVNFAADLIRTARSSTRDGVLSSAEPLIVRAKAGQKLSHLYAFSDAQIDWSDGDAGNFSNLEVSVAVVGGSLKSGGFSTVALTLHNKGKTAFSQVSVLVSEGGDPLYRQEFHFGKIGSGEQKVVEQKIWVPHSYPSEMRPLVLSLRDGQGIEQSVVEKMLPIEGASPPRLAISYSFEEGEGSDGDGLLELGESISVPIEVRNIGDVDAIGGEVWIRSHAERSLGISTGTLVVGDAAEGEKPVLKVGDTWRGMLELEFLELPSTGGARLDLFLGVPDALDYVAWQRMDLDEYVVNRVEVVLTPGQSVSEPTVLSQPQIDVTHSPTTGAQEKTAVISGYVSSADGIKEVLIYRGIEAGRGARADKVAYMGVFSEQNLKTVPFTATIPILPDDNNFVVVATDVHGFSSTHALSIYAETTR
jgi:carboxyl-terminal processing protease